ncbi:YesL family protein [Virgibacillus ndiopensis]|uniref:YesL family protein n=1 Tax=Virgibacillus ndiopensis TaxID=2004408 RepID=UPI000C071094|nr:YesL family protein [Virgibacillus ndiopensis]
MNKTSGAIYSGLEWITRFAYVNLLWILFSLMGGIVLGFFPATTAMFTIVRQWIKGNSDIPVMKSFWEFYKADFWKSNRLGLFVAGIVAIIGIDIFYIQLNNVLDWRNIPLYAFMLIFILFAFYVFPAFVHYDLKVLSVIKNAFLIMLISPLHSLLMIISLVSIYFIVQALPALAFIFGGSIYAFLTMGLSYNAFLKIEKRDSNNN